MSFDFQALNMLGYVCYSIYTCCLYFNSAVQNEYTAAFHSHNLVTLNDCCFALHGAVLTTVTCAQIPLYERGGQSLALASLCAICCFIAISIGFAVSILLHWDEGSRVGGLHLFSWLSWLYWLSLIKLVVTVSKYIPQAVSNYRRKSTVGFAIGMVLLDFTGSILSFAQLIFDGATESWSGVFGDPVKLGLSIVGLVFDIIFIIQHYVLYTDRADSRRCNTAGKEAAQHCPSIDDHVLSTNLRSAC